MVRKSKRIFILDKSYKNFILGKSHLKRETIGAEEIRKWEFGCQIIFLVFLCFVAFLITTPLLTMILEPTSNTIQEVDDWLTYLAVGVVWIPFTIYCLFWGVYRIVKTLYSNWRYWKLRRMGNLLDGEIVKVEREEPREFHGPHYVIVTYKFETPDGRTLTRTMKNERHDLRNQDLPGVGTPVIVLYANDHAVIML